MSDMDVFAAMGIAGFGKQSKKHELKADRFDKTKRSDPGPSAPAPKDEVDPDETKPQRASAAPPPPASASGKDSTSPSPGPELPPRDVGEEEPEYDPEEDYAGQNEDFPTFPVTHELPLKDHTKVVSALALDPSGARVLSGSHDYDCKLWDFGGMDARCKPFKTWEPAGSYYIHDLRYSPDGHSFLVVSGSVQPKLYDRDGEETATFIKGDPYIRDMKNTAGHVAELTSCCWHPKDSKLFITGSADSTIRIWDVENKRKQKTVIVVKSRERGARTKVTACSYSPDGKYIAAACLDGALHIWKTSSNFVRPDSTIENAHVKGTETGSLVFSVDGNAVLTRGGAGDDTVKLWDARKFKKPIAVRTGVVTLYPKTNAVFSPDNKYVVTGSGATIKGGKGKLLFLNREDLSVVKELELDATPVVVQWHPKINQILAGLTNGQISVLYSPQTSLNGAKLLTNKGPPRKITIEDMSDALAAPTILTPHALSTFKDGDEIRGMGTKRKREKDRQDPRKSRRPELPVTGPGRGGRVGASATQHVVQNLVRDTTRDEDPREALLKYAKMGEDDPQWTSGTWTIRPWVVKETDAKGARLMWELIVEFALRRKSRSVASQPAEAGVRGGGGRGGQGGGGIDSRGQGRAGRERALRGRRRRRRRRAGRERVRGGRKRRDLVCGIQTSTNKADGRVIRSGGGCRSIRLGSGITFPLARFFPARASLRPAAYKTRDPDPRAFLPLHFHMQDASLALLRDDDSASSPALDSPNTPTNTQDPSDVKIASHHSEPDTLAAPSPVPVKLPADDVAPAEHHIFSEDVMMAEDQEQNLPGAAEALTAPAESAPEAAGDVATEADEKSEEGQGASADEEEAAVGAVAEEEQPGAADVEMTADADAEVKGDADVEMRAVVPHSDAPHTNGFVNGGDAHVASEEVHTPPPPSAETTATPVATPADTSELAVHSLDINDSTSRRDDDDDAAEQPPAKRARKSSDADVASAHASASPATTIAPQLPEQTSVAAPPAEPSRTSNLSLAQHKFAVSTVRTLKKLKDATPFRLPVDPVALGIPHYLQVIKHPMDLSTIEHKLASSNPSKPDPNPNNPRYLSAEEFIADVRLMFTNSVTFNGLEHPVTLMGKRVEEVFDKQIKQLPAPEEVRAEPSWARPSITSRPSKPAPVKKAATPPPPAPPPAPTPASVPVKKTPVQRRPSTSVPVIRRNDQEGAGRPKREIHPPPTKELPYTNEPKKRRRLSKIGAQNEQLKYCGKILDQFSKKQHFATVSPFAEPVDWVKLQIPDYPKIVKKPMDLRTMREKLEAGEYPNAEKFRQDFSLIIKNCFAYNASGSPVNQAGVELQRLFDEKWRSLPPERRPVESEDDDEEEEDDEPESDVERARAIAAMEQQMASMRESIEQMKAKSVKKPKAKEPKKKKAPAPPEPVSTSTPSSSKPKKESRPPPPKKKAPSKKIVIPDDDVLSFDQKKELSDAITTLDGTKLERVIGIIHEGVPEIRDSQEEIELEIDSLPASVLTKLYNFVIRPMRPPPPKKRTGKGTGTGGLKRKSMDEEVEEAKIRKLEAQMRLFEDAETGGSGASALPVTTSSVTNGGGHASSDSSSDDDSSGSDSE